MLHSGKKIWILRFQGKKEKFSLKRRCPSYYYWLDDEDTETHSNFIHVMFACSSTTKQTSTTSYQIMSKYL